MELNDPENEHRENNLEIGLEFVDLGLEFVHLDLELEPGPEMQSVVEYWLVQSYIWLQMMALPEERL